MPSPSHGRSHKPMLARRSRLACLTGVSLVALVLCIAVGGRAYGEPQDQPQEQAPTQNPNQLQDQDPSQDQPSSQDQDQPQGSSQGQAPSQSQPVASPTSDVPDDDDIRILEAISPQLDDIRVRRTPLGTPKSQWPISAESYIHQAKRGSWPGEDSRWPTDGSLDDPRTLVAICRACEDYVNGQTSEHWETDALRHPYNWSEGSTDHRCRFGLDELPLDVETGVIVEMGVARRAVLWRGGTPVRLGYSYDLVEAPPAREDPQPADGMTKAEALRESARELWKVLASDEVMAGRRFDVPKPSASRIRVHVFEGEDDERLGYPLRTEKGLLTLVESLGDALPPDTEIVVSSAEGKQDVVGYCVSTCDHSEQPVAELTVERYANKKEAEDALNMPFAVPEELNGRKPYAWDVAVTCNRINHDWGAVPRPVAIVRYGSPSDVEGIVVMGDLLLNGVCEEVFAPNHMFSYFRYIDMPQGHSLIDIEGYYRFFVADWHCDSDDDRVYEYLLAAKQPVDAGEHAIDDYVRKVDAQTCLGCSEVERVELPAPTKAFLFGLMLVACVVQAGLL